MQTVHFLPLLLLIAVALVASCGDSSNDDDTSPESGVGGDDASPDAVYDYPFCEIDEGRVDELVSTMGLRAKVAQMYFVTVPIYPWFDIGDARRFVEKVGVGAVGLQPLSGVGLTPEWTVRNTNKIQSWALAGEYPIPAFITVDQEGGIPSTVNTLTGGTDQPGAIGLGATFDSALTRESYSIMGAELSALGINNAFSPVVEMAPPPEEVAMYMRSFGERVDQVTAHAAQAVRGFQEQLVLATAKHFPGHGTAVGDDHAQAVVNYESEETIRAYHLPPFEAAIAAGVDMIMTNHIVFAGMGETVPTTFSHRITTDLLRGELGYDGLIISDDLNMGAIAGQPLPQHPDVMAILAGVDMVLDAAGDGESPFATNPANEAWAYNLEEQIATVVAAVLDGTIDEDRIDESVRRILRAKMKYCLFENPYREPAVAAAEVNTPEQIAASKHLHEQSITLLKNEGGVWPIDPDAGLKIYVVSTGLYQSEMYPGAFWGNITGSSLVAEVQKLYPQATGARFDVDPSALAIRRLIAGAKRTAPDVLVVGTYNGFHYPRQRELVESLLALGFPTIVVAETTPCDVLAFGGADAFFVTYSNRNLAMEVAAETLFGLREPGGRLPVTISDAYPVGFSAPR